MIVEHAETKAFLLNADLYGKNNALRSRVQDEMWDERFSESLYYDALLRDSWN